LAVLAGVALHRPATWRWWLTIAAGLGLLVTGDAAYAWIEATGEPPFPSIADVFYLAGMGSLVVGLAGLARSEDRAGLRPALLDAALIAVGGSVVAWRWLVDPQIDAGVEPLAGAIAAAYPALDLVLCGVVWRHLLAPGGKSRATLLLVAGAGAFLIADLAYTSMSLDGSYESGLPIDAGWLLGYVFMGAAGLHPSMVRLSQAQPLEDVITNRRMTLIVAALVIPVIAIATTPLEDERDVVGVIVGSILVVSVVLVRLFGALVRSRTLLGEASALREALTIRATTDALTHMPNRERFIETLEAELRGGPSGLAVAFIDLDNFKQINDTWGHAVGDEVLVEASRRVRAAVPEKGLVARLGGDEFAVMIRADEPAVAAIAEGILGAFSEPARIADTLIALRPSIGVALGRDVDAVAMLREADIAMYDAKQAGGGRWSLYGDARLGGVVERYRLSVDLDHAIARGQLRLEYQPVEDLATGIAVAVEALLRWDHPIHGTVPPSTFIPLAEASGLIGTLDRWVMTQAARQVATWTEAGLWGKRFRVHVNISPREAADAGLVDFVASVLGETGVRPDALVVEVTESALLDGRGSRRCLEGLARLGVGIALDDFGTRYAVLASLATLPFTMLKIDRSFVASLGVGSQAKLFGGIARLADSLDLTTVAEGIETADQRSAVIAAGCRYGQGYLFSRPLRPEDVEPFLVKASPLFALSA
jgi:diguanylate cyclase (GGDEF)-like protein